MTTYTRMSSDSPDVPDAVAATIEARAPYVAIARRDERVLLHSLGFGSTELKVVVDGIIDQVRAGAFVIIYRHRIWDYDRQSYRYHQPRLIAASEVTMWGHWIAEVAA